MKMRWVFTAVFALFFIAYIRTQVKQQQKARQGVLAIVHVYGPIRTAQNRSAWGATDADDVVDHLHRISENKDVKAVLLRINSPGGTVGAVQEIYREIERCKQSGQKVIASLGDVAASGGYYLAASADRIVTDPGTITGSIGVIMQFGNLENLFKKVGVQLQIVKTGIHKDMGSPSRSLTVEERKLLQASIDDAYKQFLEAVQKGRHFTPEKAASLADGRIFTGRQAVALGLADELGNQQDAAQVAIKLAKLPVNPMIVSDNTRSLKSFLREASTRWSQLPSEWLDATLAGPLLEYRWR